MYQIQPTKLSDLQYHKYAVPVDIDSFSAGQPPAILEEWRWEGQLHSVADHPAVIVDGGDQLYWYTHGQQDRNEFLGPAVIHPAKNRYVKLGKLHRTSGPAVEYPNGRLEWYQHNKRHRLDGPACEWPTGRLEWWQNGLMHRTDGPAFKDKFGGLEWWLKGEMYEFEAWLSQTDLPDQEKLMIRLIYG